ncbi:3',5'-cyclic nucleotide phosphodiesterase [Polynucleobacter sp. MWH-UH19D]|uniref:hypothetical protein n=1 Tax=Polynucleobacter sp. MWH-UH19D TaxID=1855610 RepID=UPI003364E3DF
MPQSPLNEALAKLKITDLSSSSGKPLLILESLFNWSRNYIGNFEDFLGELLKTSFWQLQDYLNNPYPALCLGLASSIDIHNRALAPSEPAYHSRKHFQDVCTAMTVLLAQEISAARPTNDLWQMSREDAWLLLFCAIAHDFGHTGLTNTRPCELEKISIEKARLFLRQHSANPALQNDLQSTIEPIILATDPADLNTLLAKFTGPNANPTKTDCLSMLMVEADLLASTLPDYGKILGTLLGQEWTNHNPKAAVSVASDQGRLKFLQNIRFVSPYAIMLGMEDIRKHSIELLKG